MLIIFVKCFDRRLKLIVKLLGQHVEIILERLFAERDLNVGQDAYAVISDKLLVSAREIVVSRKLYSSEKSALDGVGGLPASLAEGLVANDLCKSLVLDVSHEKLCRACSSAVAKNNEIKIAVYSYIRLIDVAALHIS